MKRKAFTLAEMLIVVGMLGVLSAMTIPTLSYSYKGKVLETQYKTTYSDIKEIASRISIDKGDIGEYFNSKANVSADNYATEFMKYLPGSSSFNSSNLADIYGNGKKPLTFDGSAEATVCSDSKVWVDGKGRFFSFNKNNQIVCIDINGKTAPNRLNIDIFAFKPLTASQVSTMAQDSEDIESHASQIVPCDITKVSLLEPSVEGCPFYSPMENNIPLTKDEEGELTLSNSAKGKTLNEKGSYWKDYIDYR